MVFDHNSFYAKEAAMKRSVHCICVIILGHVSTVACNLANGDCSEMSPLYSSPAGSKLFLPLIFRAP
jgi:hypothetical protein